MKLKNFTNTKDVLMYNPVAAIWNQLKTDLSSDVIKTEETPLKKEPKLIIHFDPTENEINETVEIPVIQKVIV